MIKRILSHWDHLLITSALLLRVWLAASTDFWCDEAFTNLIARLPLARMIQATALDVHPPLYYLLIWVTQRLLPGYAGTEITQRIWSVIFSMAAMVVLWQILAHFQLSKVVQIGTCFLFALAPVQAYYGQEGRMYALLELLVLLQVWAALKRRWFVLGVATLASIYTHNYGIIYSMVIGIMALAWELTQTSVIPSNQPDYFPGQHQAPKENIKGLLLAFGLPALAYIPWLFEGLIPQTRFAQNGEHWIQPLTVGNIIENQVRILIGNYYPRWSTVILIMGVLAGLLLIIQATWRTQRRLLWLAFGPLVLAIIISVIVAPVLLYRGLLPATPFIYALSIYAIEQSGVTGRVFGLGILVVVLLLGLGEMLSKSAFGDLHNYYLNPDQVFAPGSTVVHLEDTTLVTMGAYAQPGVNQYLLDGGCGEDLGALGKAERNLLNVKTIKLAELPPHFTFVASVSIISNQCHQDLMNQLTPGMTTVMERSTEFGKEGMYAK